MAAAGKAGVTETPASLLAYADPKSQTVRTVVTLRGAQPFAAFNAEIDKLLAGPPGAAPEKPAGQAAPPALQ